MIKQNTISIKENLKISPALDILYDGFDYAGTGW